MRTCSPATPYKCCDGLAHLCGVVDFSRCGADVIAGTKVDPYVGVPIYYYRCEHCGFVFTKDLDMCSHQDLLVSDQVLAEGIDKWWYCAPCNGQISFFTPRSLAIIGSRPI
jgi:hypothetical protein